MCEVIKLLNFKYDFYVAQSKASAGFCAYISSIIGLLNIKSLIGVCVTFKDCDAVLVLNKDQHRGWTLLYHGHPGNCGVDDGGRDDQNTDGDLQFLI